MVDVVPQVDREFTISSAEISRRKAAFDRLGIATLVSATLAAGDLIWRGLPVSLGGVLAIVLVFLVSRVGLSRVFSRFSRTEWTVSAGSLRRTDARSDIAYPLASVRRLRTKLTTSGTIREMRVVLDDSRSVYVNAVEEIEVLRSLLLAGPCALQEVEVREPIDFDAPWFYVVFGVLIGLVIAVAVRLVVASSALDIRLIYTVCAVYSLGLGAYWLYAGPLEGRFGRSAVAADRVVGVVMLSLGLLGIAAAALSRSA